MWAVLYDDGTSLTTVSEPIAQSLAEAERQRGHQVTVRRVDDAGPGAEEDSGPGPEPVRPAARVARPGPVSEPGPVLPAPAADPAPAPEPARVAEPAREAEAARVAEAARAVRPARRRRLLPYALAAVSIVVAAALADHWDALPAVGATTSSSSTPAGGPAQRPQLLPPLDQPPVTHFSSTARGG